MIDFIYNFFTSGFFNFIFFIMILVFVGHIWNLVDLIKKRSNGIEKITGFNNGKKKKINIEDAIDDAEKNIYVIVFMMCVCYLLGNGFHTPSESMEIYAQAEMDKEQNKLREQERKEAEKLAKERKAKEEKLAEERKKQEKLAAKEEKKRLEQQAIIDKENADKNNHDFFEVNAQVLMYDLENNAARANKAYSNRYVKIVDAVVVNIESDGDFFVIDAPDGLGLRGVTCFPKYDSTREQIFSLNNGQYVTVYGKITRVGEVLGYSLDLLKIE